MTKRKFFIQGIILTIISILLRVLNLGYRSFLSQKIGTEGMGLYQLIFSIFMLSVTLSTSGISLAVTRLVTAAIIKNKRDTVRSTVTKCFIFCLTISMSIALLLFFSADFAAAVFLGNAQAAPCLRILGIGLPFMSLSTCMKGYFLAVDESVSTSVSDVLEQTLTISVTALLFWKYAPEGLEKACMAAMLASTLGEIASFLFNFIMYRISLFRNTPKQRRPGKGVLHGLMHIAVPCTLSAAARSMLNTAENLLIPKELQKHGLNYSAAMSQYGLLQGMAMPILYFPSSLIFSFGNLLIPKLSMARERKQHKSVEHLTGQAIKASLLFGILFACIFFAFGESWGIAFYNHAQAGDFLKILAPIVPLIYLDVVVDSLLKGMDEQFNSMKFNLADSSLRVLLVLVLLRFFGIDSYIGIIFFSTIFNATLSVARLVKVTHIHLNVIHDILLPIPIAAVSVFLTSRIFLLLPAFHPILTVFMQILLSAVIYAPIVRMFSHTKKESSPS